jgi:hypothetical protein
VRATWPPTRPSSTSSSRGKGADVAVTARDDPQARSAGGGRQIPAQPGHHRLARGAVQREDAAGHGGVEAGRHPLRDRRGHAPRDQQRRQLGARRVERPLHPRLSRLRRLPHLGELVPGVPGMQDPDGIRRPAAERVRAADDRQEHEHASPVVPEDVSRLAEALSAPMSQSRYPAGVTGKSGGAAAPKPGGDKRTGSRPAASSDGARWSQTAAVSGFPWTSASGAMTSLLTIRRAKCP